MAERSEQEPAEAERRTATQCHGSSTLLLGVSGTGTG